MSIWDEIVSKADNFSLSDAKNGASALFDAYTQSEQSRATGHENARADQANARYTPEVESQNQGEPVSVRVQQPQTQLVGEAPKDAAMVDKKIIYAGGVLVALLLIGGMVMLAKK